MGLIRAIAVGGTGWNCKIAVLDTGQNGEITHCDLGQICGTVVHDMRQNLKITVGDMV